MLFVMLFSVLMSGICFADEQFFSDKMYAKMELSVSSELEVEPESSEFFIDFIRAEISLYPQDNFMQEAMSVATEPHAEFLEDSLLFEWDSPEPETLPFGYEADILVLNKPMKIKHKAEFPIRQQLDEEIFNYTLATDTIDSDELDIAMLASSLAEGEDDLFIIVNKLASWTNENINYNLSTVTASVSKTASWTLKNRQGVCDEMTSLFIAMARSLGIPSRFIAGISYTNSELFAYEWGPHGWVEVYFQGVGWVPYDPTYGQYGFIDPSHIKLKDSYDPNEPTTVYKWKSHDADINPANNLDIDVVLYEVGDKIKMPVQLEAEFLNDEVGFGSYQLLEVTANNIMDYYVATDIHAYVPKEVVILGDDRVSLAIEPNGKKSTYFVMKINEDLNDKLIYTFPVKLLTTRNQSRDIMFDSSEGSEIISYEDIKEIIDQRQEESEKTYSVDVEMNCSLDKDIIYIGDDVMIDCFLRNIGNKILQEINICLENECTNTTLGINQIFRKSYNTKASESGIQKLSFFARSPDFSKSSSVRLKVMDKPEIIISDIDEIMSVGYWEDFNISFALNKNSDSNPKNVTVRLFVSGSEKQWSIDELFTDQNFIIGMNSRSLGPGRNKINIIVDYYDDSQGKYTVSEEAYIEIEDLSIFQKIIVNISSASRRIAMFIGGLFR